MSDSNNARAAEANDAKTLSVEFRGETFTVPTEYADYPLGFIEAVGDDKPPAIQLRELLGAEQWATVREVASKGSDIEELMRLIGDARGIDAGNSPASSD